MKLFVTIDILTVYISELLIDSLQERLKNCIMLFSRKVAIRDISILLPITCNKRKATIKIPVTVQRSKAMAIINNNGE